MILLPSFFPNMPSNSSWRDSLSIVTRNISAFPEWTATRIQIRNMEASPTTSFACKQCYALYDCTWKVENLKRSWPPNLIRARTAFLWTGWHLDRTVVSTCRWKESRFWPKHVLILHFRRWKDIRNLSCWTGVLKVLRRRPFPDAVLYLVCCERSFVQLKPLRCHKIRNCPNAQSKMKTFQSHQEFHKSACQGKDWLKQLSTKDWKNVTESTRRSSFWNVETVYTLTLLKHFKNIPGINRAVYYNGDAFIFPHIMFKRRPSFPYRT